MTKAEEYFTSLASAVPDWSREDVWSPLPKGVQWQKRRYVVERFDSGQAEG
jgi:hypothetical protein